MHVGLIRRIGASALSASLLVTSLGFLPAATFAQTENPKKESKKKKETKNEIAQATNSGQKALSTKEDPGQIGKRKINSGTDKLFGWLGGSQEKEIALGRQLALEVEQSAKLVEDPIVTEYVNRVGQNIVLHSDAKIPFTIKVIDSDEVNAFALPGGFFFVNRGLILAADNESELAGVMAHEIAHVAARHAMENQGKLQAINYGLLATIIFGGGIASTVAQNAGGFGQLLSFLKFSRSAEMEADMLGVQYLYASGYDPTGMATMFEKLNAKNKKKPGTLAKIFSTHPQSLDRRDASIALVARFPEKQEYIISTSEFQRVKSHLMKLTNAKAGVIGGDLDEDGSGRPTLKRRQPEPDGTTPDADGSSSSSSDGPPQLKRRNEPSPSPSPSPEM
ncbi:MAG: M48 family metallopeptidase [Pyrinomonadaceae bacterium]|nr:M48 family metallopeptidase [Pyrinomonadaceae bacterium]